MSMHTSEARKKRRIAYCTNVHAGADLDRTVANLQQHALAVKERFSPDQPMGIGLWLAASSARSLVAESRLRNLADWLQEHGLVPWTLNGFPFGDFHQRVVKHAVYQPPWFAETRLQYTLDLVRILDRLLPPGMEGSISTLPIAWGEPAVEDSRLAVAAEKLAQVADRLAALEAETGRLLYLCLEPEPGCVLQRANDVVRFFHDFLLPGRDATVVCRHLRVCHDICHAAVMFEDQQKVLELYAAESIHVGKVQVSSAVHVDFEQLPVMRRAATRDQLAAFAEDRYLHQTTILQASDGRPAFYEDLPLALEEARQAGTLRGRWRVHFHVPIYLQEFGALGTTQTEILHCLHAMEAHPDCLHYEVETYAWTVLPAELQQEVLADGIAREMSWLDSHEPGTEN